MTGGGSQSGFPGYGDPGASGGDGDSQNQAGSPDPASATTRIDRDINGIVE